MKKEEKKRRDLQGIVVVKQKKRVRSLINSVILNNDTENKVVRFEVDI